VIGLECWGCIALITSWYGSIENIGGNRIAKMEGVDQLKGSMINGQLVTNDH
jgi:hypothetical protein